MGKSAIKIIEYLDSSKLYAFWLIISQKPKLQKLNKMGRFFCIKNCRKMLLHGIVYKSDTKIVQLRVEITPGAVARKKGH